MTLILLDRDGVINFDSKNYIRAPSDWQPIPGSIEAMARLVHAGCKLAICSNQSGIARGFFTHETLSQIHSKMHDLLKSHNVKLDAVYYCPHHPDSQCKCRKPNTGMLYQALSDLSSSPSQTWFIGDSLKDMQAALTINCHPILVRTGNGYKHEADVRALGIDNIRTDLSEAADWIIDSLVSPAL